MAFIAAFSYLLWCNCTHIEHQQNKALNHNLLHLRYQELLIVDADVDVSVGDARDDNLENASEPVEVGAAAEAPLDIDNTVVTLLRLLRREEI